MPELVAILAANRDKQYEHQKFLAALQGVDLDGQGPSNKNAWEDMKARVFSGGAAQDANDILSLQGQNAARAGFGIGAGLEYTDAKDLENPSW